MNGQTPRAVLAIALVALSVSDGQTQETLERTTNLSGAWIAQEGYLYMGLPFRFIESDRSGRHLIGRPTFEAGLGLPRDLHVGGRFAPESPVVPGRPSEWDVHARARVLAAERGAPLDLALEGGFNGAARSFDGEIAVARWWGPLRLLVAGRGMSDGYRADDARVAVAGGAVIHPAIGGAPIAVAADLGTLLDRSDGERVAWSAAVQLGLSFTDHTLSVFATNTGSSTLQGRSLGTERVHYGFEVTVPVPVGRFVGWYVPREEAMEAVEPAPPSGVPAVHARITRYIFAPKRIEIPAGAVVEWSNLDRVVHTVTAEDGSWDSGGIQPGERWSARCDEPGVYPFLCGPHPFMKGVVIVR